MGPPVVFQAHAFDAITQIQSVRGPTGAVRDPQLRLGRRQATVDDHQPKMAFLPALGSPVGQRNKFPRLAHSA
jgi:hypothetical protein